MRKTDKSFIPFDWSEKRERSHTERRREVLYGKRETSWLKTTHHCFFDFPSLSFSLSLFLLCAQMKALQLHCSLSLSSSSSWFVRWRDLVEVIQREYYITIRSRIQRNDEDAKDFKDKYNGKLFLESHVCPASSADTVVVSVTQQLSSSSSSSCVYIFDNQLQQRE